jgi:hypothetical protein
MEEHTEMFPKCRRSKMDLIALRGQLSDKKTQLEKAEQPKGDKPGLLERLIGSPTRKAA